jgi:hypothetical protein
MAKSIAKLLTVSLLLATSFRALAYDQIAPPMKESQIREVLTNQRVPNEIIDQLIVALNAGPDGKGGSAEIGAALFTSGWNGAFFVDNNWWQFDAVVNNGHSLVKIPELYNVDYFNGGLNVELSYKFTWIFLPAGTSLSSLDGAEFGGPVFGRGLEVRSTLMVGNPFFGQFGWVQRTDGMPGNAFIVSGGIETLTAFAFVTPANRAQLGKIIRVPQITFPSLTFRQRKVLPPNF